MQLSKLFTTIGCAVTFAISSIPLPQLEKASAQSTVRPFAILVQGKGDCCITAIKAPLERMGVEVRIVPWNALYAKSIIDNKIYWAKSEDENELNDKKFLTELADFANSFDPNRPLILIGHSFGGDSLLSAVPRITNRRILFLGVLDPVAAGGLREPIRSRGVPSNVDYFFNRYQTTNVWPVENRILGANEDGTVGSCSAKVCDQQEQSLLRREDGSDIRVECDIIDPTCPGFQLFPPRAGTAAIRLQHEDFPRDKFVQRQIIDILNQQLAAFTPPPPITTPVTTVTIPPEQRQVEVCVDVDAKTGWKTYELEPGISLVGVSSVSGSWSVDDKNYSRVGSEGHSEPNLDAFEQFKYERKYPFGALLVVDPGQGYTPIKGLQRLPTPISDRVTLRINDSDSSLGDNGGVLTVCFGNENVMQTVKLTPEPEPTLLRYHWEYLDTNGRTGTFTFTSNNDWVNNDAFGNKYNFKENGGGVSDHIGLYDSSRDFYVLLYDDGRSYWKQGSSGTWNRGVDGQWVNPTRFSNNWTNTCLASLGDSKAIDNPVVVSNCLINTVPNNGMWYVVINGEAVTPNVMWYVSSNGEIRNAWTNTCLASLGDSKAIDNPVVVTACSGKANTLWDVASDGEIRNRWTDTCLASLGDSKAIDNPVVVAACSGNANILWTTK